MSLRDFQTVACLGTSMSDAGEGAYSSVYRVRRFRDDKEYALKKVKIGNLS